MNITVSWDMTLCKLIYVPTSWTWALKKDAANYPGILQLVKKLVRVTRWFKYDRD